MTQRLKSFTYDRLQLSYLLSLPDNYVASASLPLILFLHDADQRGTDPELLKAQGLPKRLEAHADLPFIVASPQLPPGMWWATMNLAWLDALVEQLTLTQPVDPNRIYLTGIGMGGYGAWALATAYPQRFAALVPICGGGDPIKACQIKSIPVWAIHGAKDNVVLPRESARMVDALTACGGHVKYTLFESAGHDAWTPAYNSPALYSWLLKQHKEE